MVKTKEISRKINRANMFLLYGSNKKNESFKNSPERNIESKYCVALRKEIQVMTPIQYFLQDGPGIFFR